MTAALHDFIGRRGEAAAMLVLLTLDGITLALPQHEIGALEPTLDVKPNTSGSGNRKSNAAGVLTINGSTCPVYALGAELNCLSSIPAAYRVCVVINSGSTNSSGAIGSGHNDPFALACAEVQFVPRAQLPTYALPRLLVKQRTPIKSLLITDNRLVLATNVDALFAHVAHIDAEVISFDERSRRMRS